MNINKNYDHDLNFIKKQAEECCNGLICNILYPDRGNCIYTSCCERIKEINKLEK